MVILYNLINTLEFAQKPKTHWQRLTLEYAKKMLRRAETLTCYEMEFEEIEDIKYLLLGESNCLNWCEYVHQTNCQFDGYILKRLDAFFYYQDIGCPEEVKAYELCGTLPMYDGYVVPWDELLHCLLEDAWALIKRISYEPFYCHYYSWIFSERP